jgi:hypothetical protein
VVNARRSGRASRAIRAGLMGVAVATATLFSACRRAPEPPAPLAVALATPAAATSAVVELSGLTREERDALATNPPDTAGWEALFRVAVEAGPGAPPPPAVAGRYEIVERLVRFTPAFPLEAGRRYDVRVDLSRLRREGTNRTLETSVALPAGPVPAPSTRVAGVSPAGDTVPENLLRIYVWFSAPMSRGSGVPHVRLFDERGEVRDAFLPVDGGFWNHDFTRYTLFFDPGRVKDGILAHERMGRPLVAGHRYRLAISRDWRDARGAPLVEPFEHAFRAGAAATRALDIAAWQITVPRAGTREPLVLRFPAALDRALALRTIGVEMAGGAAVDGEVSIDASDTRWQLVPRAPWTSGRHAIVALDALEDPAGNRLGRAFEVALRDASKASDAPRVTRAFDVVAR